MLTVFYYLYPLVYYTTLECRDTLYCTLTPTLTSNLTLTLSPFPHPKTKATDQWLMALLQGFWFGTAVLEPMEVAPPSRDYDAACAIF